MNVIQSPRLETQFMRHDLYRVHIDAGGETSMANATPSHQPGCAVVAQTYDSDFATYVQSSAILKLVSSTKL